MKTTLNKIREYSPCLDGWNKLLKSQGKVKSDNDQIDLIDILKSNGIKDAVWCLRCFDYKEYCLFLADVAESVLVIYENKHPNEKSPRDTIKAIRQHQKGDINITQLAYAAYAAAAAAAYAAASDSDSFTADYSACTTFAASAAYAAAASASAASASAASASAYAAAASAAAYSACTTSAASDYTTARKSKWKEIEELFIKHFG